MHLLWLGLLLYYAYSYMMYAFAPFTDVFLLYLAVIGLSSYGLFDGLVRLRMDVVSAVLERAPRRATAVFLIVVALLFIGMWLSMIRPAIWWPAAGWSSAVAACVRSTARGCARASGDGGRPSLPCGTVAPATALQHVLRWQHRERTGHGMDINDVVAQAKDAMTVKRVFGEPYEVDGITVIPAARVRGGGGAGTSNDEEDGGSGTGFGLDAKPAGAFVVRDKKVTWQPAVDVNRVVVAIAVVVVTIVLARARVVRGSGRDAGSDTPRRRRGRRGLRRRGACCG